MVRRDPADGHRLGRRQGCQPRRAHSRRPPRATGIRHHRRGVPRLDRPRGHPGAARGHPRRGPDGVTGRPRRAGGRGTRPRARGADPQGTLRQHREGLPAARQGHPGGRAVVGHRRGRRGHLVRRDERDVHQRRRRGAAAGPRRGLLGLAVEGPLHLLPRRQGPDRRAGHRRGGPGDGSLGALGGHVHRRPLDRADGSHRDRGRLRPGRGGRQRPGRARHLRRGEGRARGSCTPGWARSPSRSCAGPTARTSGSSSTPTRAAAGCSPTRRSSRWRAWASPPRPTTARPRTPSGPWRVAAPTWCSHGPSPRSAAPRRPPRLAETGTLLVQGLAASAGRASGVVRVLAVARPGRPPAGR